MRRYVLITPCRNEADFLPITIKAIASQTVRPAKWVIVDDGSTDATPEILAEAEREHDFIQVVQRSDRGKRVVGSGVVEAFYDGLSHVDLGDYDYVCKLDGDLDLDPKYFETLMERFESDPWLGSMSGKCFMRTDDGRLIEERIGDEAALGAAKFYRVECFEEIGGFVRGGVCWDGIDGHMCRLKGWVACSEDIPELRIVHLRQMGSSHKGIWTGRKRWGGGKHFMGSRFYYVLAVATYRLAERPFVLGGVGILCGYLGRMLRREKQFGDAEYLAFFRKYELTSLLRGKSTTAREYHDRIRSTMPAKVREPEVQRVAS